MLVVKADSIMNNVYREEGFRFWSIRGMGGIKASHWMPLPNPPETQSEN